VLHVRAHVPGGILGRLRRGLEVRWSGPSAYSRDTAPQLGGAGNVRHDCLGCLLSAFAAPQQLFNSEYIRVLTLHTTALHTSGDVNTGNQALQTAFSLANIISSVKMMLLVMSASALSMRSKDSVRGQHLASRRQAQCRAHGGCPQRQVLPERRAAAGQPVHQGAL